MKFKELKRSLAASVAPIYLLSGEDAFFLSYSIKLITDKVLSNPELNLTEFEGSEIKGNPDKLLSALLCYPFASKKRVVVAKEYYPLAQDMKALASYFENPCETTVFIVRNQNACASLAAKKNVASVDCSKGDDALLSSWISNRAKTGGVGISVAAVRKIIEFCGSDMTRINGETDKLISYALDKGEISEADVEALCVKENDYKLYETVDFIANKRYDKAYESFIESVGAVGEWQKLFVSLYYHFRKLFYVATSNESDKSLAEYLGIKEYAVKKAREQARRFSTKRLKAAMDKLGEEDSDFKQGKLEAQTAIWNGVLNVLVG